MKFFTRFLLALFLCAISMTLCAQGSYYFWAHVDFDPDYAGGVDVTLACNSGIPLTQVFHIEEGFPIEFTVMEFNEGECSLSQSPVEGYSASYYANGEYSDDSCYFSGENLLTDNQCRIFNSGAAPVSKRPISGYESIEQYGFIPGWAFEIIEARCSEGKKVLGGGWRFLSGGDWQIGELGPSADGRGYFLGIESLSEEPQEVMVTAICASVSE